VAQQPKLVPGRLFFELSIPHTSRHTPGRTPLSKLSARRGGRYLHHKRKGRDAFSTVRTRASSSQGAADLSLRPHGPRPLGSPSKAFGPHCSWPLFTINTRVSLPMYRLLTPVHSFPKYLPHSFSVFVRHLSPVNRFPEVHPSPHPRKTGFCTNFVYGKPNCLSERIGQVWTRRLE
jgi:hypothetical protein